MPEENSKNGKVSLAVFGSVVSVILIGMGWILTALANTNNKVEDFGKEMAEYKADIREIKTNTAWIMDTLKVYNSNPKPTSK